MKKFALLSRLRPLGLGFRMMVFINFVMAAPGAEPSATLESQLRHTIRQITEGERAETFVAWNPGQRWSVSFDRRGFLAQPKGESWSWGLALAGYGYGDSLIKTPPLASKVSAEGQRLTYQWDANLEEWFINDERGLEHGFTVQQRPSGAHEEAALAFNLQVLGGLRPEIVAAADGVRFLDSEGATALTYSGLKAWDAQRDGVGNKF